MALETSLEKIDSSLGRLDEDEASEGDLSAAVDELIKLLLTAKIGTCALGLRVVRAE